MQKKMLAILLTLCMLLGMFPFAIMAEETVVVEEVVETTEAAVEPTADEAEEEIVEPLSVEEENTLVPLNTTVDLTDGIDTAEELLTLMNDSSLWAGNYVLNKTIDLSDYTGDLKQAPIGNLTTAFSGTFDGQDNTIKGINLVTTDNTVKAWGFFGVLSGATVQNLTVEGNVKCTSTGVGSGQGNTGVGGLAGLLINGGTLSNITTKCKVEGTYKVGGVIGQCLPGDNTMTMTDITNEGAVEVTGIYAGGIFGRFECSKAQAKTLTNIRNKGDVTTTYSSGNYAYIGGLTGVFYAYNTTQVTNVQNEGTITGHDAVGGIVGLMRGASNNTDVIFTNVVNLGEVHATGVHSTNKCVYLGGVVSYGEANKKCGFKNVYTGGKLAWDSGTKYTGPILAANNAGNVVTNGFYTTNLNAGTAYSTTAGGKEITADTDLSVLGEGWLLVEGYAPELKVFHDHKLSYVVDGDKHYQVCYCGDKTTDPVAHEYDAETNQCVCGAYNCTHDKAVETPRSAANCQSPAIYYDVCECGYVSEDYPKGEIDPSKHVTPDDTYTAATGEKEVTTYYSCCDQVSGKVTVDTEINSAAELLALMNQTDAAYLALSYTLGGEIDMTDVAGQSAIGSKDLPFTGSFDGQGYAIKGLNLVAPDEAAAQAWGLFAHVQDGTVQNLTVYGTVSSAYAIKDVGIIAATGVGAVIGAVGGKSVVQNIKNYATVTANNGVGGVIGRVYAMVGVDNTGNVYSNLRNYGAVNGTTWVGGVIGRIDAATEVKLTHADLIVEAVYNEGTVTATGRYVGGITSMLSSGAAVDGHQVGIKNAWNAGAVTGLGEVAGIVAYQRLWTASNDYTRGIIYNALNTGALTLTGSGANSETAPAGCYAGGIVAYVYTQATYTNCYSVGTISAPNTDYCIKTICGTVRTASVITECYYAASALGTSASTDSVSTADTGLVDDAGTAQTIADRLTFAEGWYYPTVTDEEGNETTTVALTALCEHTYDAETKKCTNCGMQKVCENGEHKNFGYTVLVTSTDCTVEGTRNYICTDCLTVIEANQSYYSAEHASELLSIEYVEGTGLVYKTPCCGNTLYKEATVSADVYADATGTSRAAMEAAGEAFAGTNAKFANLKDALAYAAAATKAVDGVTVHIVGEHDLGGALYLPEWEEMVTITGDGDDENRINIPGENGIYAGGPVTLKDIYLNNTAKTFHLVGRNHELIVDSGVKVNYVKDVQHAYLYGGYNISLPTPNAEVSGNITVRSGNWHIVSAGNRACGATFTGTQKNKLTLDPGENDTLIIHALYTTGINVTQTNSDILVTVKVDGAVQIDKLYAAAVIDTEGNLEKKYNVDLLLDGDLTGIGTDAEGNAKDWNWTTLSSSATGIDGVFAVYAMDGADADDVAKFSSLGNISVIKGTYADYCVKINGEHPDEDKDGNCDFCGTALGCTADSHPTNTNFVWAKNTETGAYYVACSACENNIKEQTAAPAVYVNSESGADANDGFTAETAVATLTEAVKRIAATGGTVYFQTNYDLAGNTETLGAWEGTINFEAGVKGGVRPERGLVNTSATPAVLILNGAANFDKIYFAGGATYTKTETTNEDGTTTTTNVASNTNTGEIHIVANWNDLSFGYLRVAKAANVHIIAGGYKITEDNTEKKDVKISIKGVGNLDPDGGGNLTGNYGVTFYEKIYLGDIIGKNDLKVANKTVTLNVEQGRDWNVDTESYWQARIGDIRASSTSSDYAILTLSEYKSTITLNNSTYVGTIYSGEDTVNNGGTAWLDSLTLNLNDNSTFGADTVPGEFKGMNISKSVINISDQKDGRTTKLDAWFGFFGYGDSAKQQSATAELNLGCGSSNRAAKLQTLVRLSSSTANIGTDSSTKPLDDDGNVRESVKNAITINFDEDSHSYSTTPTSTTLPAAGEDGEYVYTCTVCGATKTEPIEWSCETYGHNYVLTADGIACIYNCGIGYAEGDAEIRIDMTSVEKGGTVTVPVYVTTKKDITMASFTVDLPEGLTMTGWESGFETTESEDELNSGWQILGTEPVDGAYADPCMFAILYLGTEEVTNADGKTETVLGDASLGEDKVVATLTLEAAEDFAGGTIAIAVEEAYNADEDAIATTTISAAVTATNAPVAGDVTEDGELTIVDALLILKALLNDTVADLKNADANEDGKISLADVINVLNRIPAVEE